MQQRRHAARQWLFQTILVVSMILWGCAESSSTSDNTPDLLGDTAADTSSSSSGGEDTSSSSSGGDTSSDTPDMIALTEYGICLLGEAEPDGECQEGDTLDFGLIGSGETVMRRLRIDNTGDTEIGLQDINVNTAQDRFEIRAYRVEQDPGDPNSTLEIDATLPLTRASGQTLYVDVSFTGDASTAPLPASMLIIQVDTGLTELTLHEVPLSGETSGCPSGTADCGGAGTCDTEVDTSLEHCGGCNAPCAFDNAAEACVDGICNMGACEDGYSDCDGLPENGCETNILTSLEHCGGCTDTDAGTDFTCDLPNVDEACVNGECTVTGACEAGWSLCPGDLGCATNTTTDVMNCGGCDQICARDGASAVCNNSCIYTCNPGYTDCNTDLFLPGSDGCEINTDANVNNCGGCGASFACTPLNASARCEFATCLIESCDADWLNCDGTYDTGCDSHTTVDPDNCGGCGLTQPAGGVPNVANICDYTNATGVCNNSICEMGACDAGWGDCTSADGCETPVTTADNCGGCGASSINYRCNDVYPNSDTTCDTTLACEWNGCSAGWQDLDEGGSPAPGGNGCEYACVATGTDLPDIDSNDTFADVDCDGIDGDESVSIFVSPLGNDANPGTRALPVRNVSTGIAKVVSTAGKSHLLVASGTYTIGSATVLSNGVSIFGGYDPTTWQRSNNNQTILNRNGNPNGSGRVIALQGDNITGLTYVDRLVIQTANASGTSATNYALHCNNCDGLKLSNSTLSAGNGSAGSAGSNGSNGVSGGSGTAGNSGSCDGSSGGGGSGGTNASCSRNGGAGGNGGSEGYNSGAGGGTGAIGMAGGTGGPRGDCDGGDGGNGTLGVAGTAGSNGAGGNGGTVTSNYWVPDNGDNGANGTHGNGGGGGGGGAGQGNDGCCSICNNGGGNGGGGGGAGGCRGTYATGGTAGGGSFGLFLVGSTGITLTNNTITAGDGGRGGNAGTGGSGGTGGAGANGANACTSEVGKGGNGRNGGAGGRGGHGGGGAGGVSYAIYRSGTTVSTSGNSLIAGNGGVGGSSSGNNGTTGTSATTN